GWEFDVPDRPMAMRIHVPVATDGGKPITGVVRAAWTAAASAKDFFVTDLAPYDAVDPDGPDSSLLACPSMRTGPCEEVKRAAWRVKGHAVTLDPGFVPGTTYR